MFKADSPQRCRTCYNNLHNYRARITAQCNSAVTLQYITSRGSINTVIHLFDMIDLFRHELHARTPQITQDMAGHILHLPCPSGQGSRTVMWLRLWTMLVTCCVLASAQSSATADWADLTTGLSPGANISLPGSMGVPSQMVLTGTAFPVIVSADRSHALMAGARFGVSCTASSS
jgi:hypothetical protein